MHGGGESGYVGRRGFVLRFLVHENSYMKRAVEFLSIYILFNSYSAGVSGSKCISNMALRYKAKIALIQIWI